eukprot:125949-Rhodomonas_salina.3
MVELCWLVSPLSLSPGSRPCSSLPRWFRRVYGCCRSSPVSKPSLEVHRQSAGQRRQAGGRRRALCSPCRSCNCQVCGGPRAVCPER